MNEEQVKQLLQQRTHNISDYCGRCIYSEPADIDDLVKEICALFSQDEVPGDAGYKVKQFEKPQVIPPCCGKPESECRCKE
jgi:hypothetical protein